MTDDSGAAAPFDATACSEIEALLTKRHTQLRRQERLSVSGELGHGHALVELVVEDEEVGSRFTAAVAVETELNDLQNPLQAREHALDYLDTVLADYFERGRRTELLPVWDAHDVNGIIVKVRGEFTQPALDAAADAFLAEHGFADDGTPGA